MVESIGSFAFLVFVALANQLIGVAICRWLYATQIGDLRRAKEYSCELLFREQTEHARAIDSVKSEAAAEIAARNEWKYKYVFASDALEQAVSERDAAIDLMDKMMDETSEENTKLLRELANLRQDIKDLNQHTAKLAKERNELLDWKVRVGTKLGETAAEAARLSRELGDTEERLLRAKQESISFQGQLATAVGNLQRLASTGDPDDKLQLHGKVILYIARDDLSSWQKDWFHEQDVSMCDWDYMLIAPHETIVRETVETDDGETLDSWVQTDPYIDRMLTGPFNPCEATWHSVEFGDGPRAVGVVYHA